MDKLKKYLMLLLVATLSLTFTACGGDDDDEPNTPNVSGKVESFNLQVNGNGHLLVDLGYSRYVALSLRGGPKLVVSGGLNSKIKYFGEVKSIKDITYQNMGAIIDTEATAIDNGGYVIEYIYDGNAYYIRLRITLNKSNGGEVIGCNVQWQQF